jgi:hypothetical protein
MGRSKRDMHRIPVTGLALYLLPEIATEKKLEWLENTWSSELNSLTYKAAYTILAFNKNEYKPKKNNNLILKLHLGWQNNRKQVVDLHHGLIIPLGKMFIVQPSRCLP